MKFIGKNSGRRLYCGFLAFVLPEAFAGSSANWILNPWSWFVTFPLYFAHFYFFTFLAIKTKRTSLKSLYLWGMLYGLYESWITKVIWSSFGDDPTPLFGSIFALSIYETILLVFFWHPIFAFLLPLALTGRIFAPTKADSIFPGIMALLDKKTAFGKYLLPATLTVACCISGVNIASPISILITYVPTTLILYFGYIFLKPKQKAPATPIQSFTKPIPKLYPKPLEKTVKPTLHSEQRDKTIRPSFKDENLLLKIVYFERTGLKILIAYMVLLYILTFLLLRFERINIQAIISTISLYVVISFWLYLIKMKNYQKHKKYVASNLFSPLKLFSIFLFMIVVILVVGFISTLITGLVFILLSILFVALIILSFFILLFIKQSY